jgi:tight adherence protein B
MIISVVCATLFFFALSWWLHPRITTYTDRQLSLPRLCFTLIHLDTSPETHSNVQKSSSHEPHFVTSVEVVEELIRHTRSGIHAQDALATVFARSTSLSPHLASVSESPSRSVAHILISCAQSCQDAHQHDDAQMCRMLLAAFVHGAFIPAALENVLTSLRTQRAISADIRTASAQALFTTRILTYLPGVALGVLLISSSDIRSRLFHLSTVSVLGVGLFLNRLGAWWIHRLMTHTLNRPVDETMMLAEHLAASLRAGCSLSECLQRWEHISPIGTKIAHEITHGAPLDRALHHLPHTPSGYRLGHTIVSGHKDGLPLVNTVHRLMSDVHNDRRSATETVIRQLPGRLSAPLVLCILPSFLIIAVVPLIVHSLGQLGPALSPALTAVS